VACADIKRGPEAPHLYGATGMLPLHVGIDLYRLASPDGLGRRV
jgi:hypothetical protein